MASISFNPKEIWSFTKNLFSSYTEHNVFSLAAALAYYTIFSLAPILIIVITIAGLFFGKEAMQNEIYQQLNDVMGDQAAKQAQEMVENANARESGLIAAILSIATLIFGATGVFNELKSSLNSIWSVKAKPKNGIWGMVRDRLLSFAMVVSIGFLLLVSLVLNAAVAMVGKYFSTLIPEAGEVMLQVFNAILSIGVSTLLFAVVFKVLPDVNIRYSDVWKGAWFTAILFTLGKFLIGLYIGQSDISGTYGAAGSIVIILLWVYYSSLILFLGADFTYVYASRYGSEIRPSTNGVRIITKEVSDEEGMQNEANVGGKPKNAPPRPIKLAQQQNRPSERDEPSARKPSPFQVANWWLLVESFTKTGRK